MKLGIKSKLVLSAIALCGIMLAGAALLPASELSGIPDNSGLTQNIQYKGHIDVYKIPANTGKPELIDSKDNLLVTNGKTYIRTQIGSGSASASSSASYLSLSNDTTAPDAAWTNITAEITTNGLARAQGTYAANGTGAWNFSKTWTATGAQSARLVGLNYGNTANDGTLFASVQFSSAPLATNDQLQIIYSIAVS